MISVGYITAPRPKPTIDASLRSFKAAGFPDNIYIRAEPDTPTISTDVDVTIWRNEQKLGNLRNWVACAEELLYWETSDDWVMICEDDITWARNAHDVLQYDLRHQDFVNVQAISLYCADRMARLIKPDMRLVYGYHPISVGKQMWGAQCLVMRKDWLSDLLACDYFKAKLGNPELDKNVDRFIAESAQQRALNIAYRIPCLVDHIMGDRNSSLYGDKDRPLLRTHFFKDPAE